MLLWYRIRDSRLWPLLMVVLVVLVFASGFWLGGRGASPTQVEGYRRAGTPAPPVTNTVPLGTTTTMAPSSTLAALLPLDAVRMALNDALTESTRNRLEKPTVEVLGRFFDAATSVGLADDDGDGVDDDGVFSYVTGDVTACVVVWGEAGPKVTEGACEK
jgi:hypothetical protein